MSLSPGCPKGRYAGDEPPILRLTLKGTPCVNYLYRAIGVVSSMPLPKHIDDIRLSGR